MATADREFDFSDQHFQRIKQMIGDYAGISLSDAKRDMVYGRLVRRIRLLNLQGFNPYLELVEQPHSNELVNFVNALTTNLTSFFRENHHFSFLTNTALPQLIAARGHSRKIRIWSAGCSTGEEPYSIAITCAEFFANYPGWDVSIVASDLDTNVVNTARNGVYAMDRVKGIPQDRLKKWFMKGTGSNHNRAKVKPVLQQKITFKQINLLHDWPFHEPFDIIFCRNVVIYFNKDTQRGLFDRFGDILADDGFLIIGHSESLHRVTDRFKLIGQTIHSKLY